MNIFGWLSRQTPVSNALKLYAQGASSGNTGSVMALTPDGLDMPLFALARRQGGSATHWGTTGTTNYDPGVIRVIAGSMVVNILNGTSVGITQVTWAQPFSAQPLVVYSPTAIAIFGTSLKHTQFEPQSGGVLADVQVDTLANVTADSNVQLMYLAFGPI